jgi:hypothetical protein
MHVIYRNGYTNLNLTIVSNETMGILDTERVEDYNGINGCLTLYHQSSGMSYQIAMSNEPSITPHIPFDVFRGSYLLSALPDGLYEVRGRMSDLAGNYAILSSFGSPSSGTVFPLSFEIRPGYNKELSCNLFNLVISLSYNLKLDMINRSIILKDVGLSTTASFLHNNLVMAKLDYGMELLDVHRSIRLQHPC